MKKIFLSALAFMAVLAVKAQEIPERKADAPTMHHKEHRLGKDHMMGLKELNLTDDQKEQFKKEAADFRKKMEELKKNDGITVKEWREKMEALRNEHKTRIQGLLTTEQKTQMEKMKQEGAEKRKDMAEKHKGMMERHKGMMDKRGDLKERLQLTDEQQAKMKEMHKDMSEKAKAIRENKSLSDEKKREEIKELMKSRQDKLKTILTEEQLNKLKEGRKEGDHKRTEKKEVI
jgi:Spy/CpxP family protein refolding chaperone